MVFGVWSLGFATIEVFSAYELRLASKRGQWTGAERGEGIGRPDFGVRSR